MLRRNQIEPVRLGVEFFQKPNAPAIIVAPVAFGKSHVIAEIAQQVGQVLVVQPSKELLEQNFNKFTALGGMATIYSASMNRKEVSNVTYATIGSIYKHGEMFKGFTRMIIDEVHAYPRESSGMLQTFIRTAGITHVLGLTATALKLQTNMGLDGRPYSKLQMLTSRSKKGTFFKNILHVAQVKEMVELGYWSPLIYEQYDMDLSGLQYNSSRSEYTEESMDRVYRGNNVHAKILKKISETDRKSILVFVPSVAEAIELCAQTPNAAVVHSGTSKEERQMIIDGFKTKQIRVVYNVNILSTGFDHPEIDCIILGRPTSSLSLYYQQIGRGTRIHENKKDCLVVDFSGNVRKFGKVEHLEYRKEGMTWGIYGEGNKLLTGIPMHELGKNPAPLVMPWGKYKGIPVHLVPLDYRKWALRELKWTTQTHNLKQAIINSLNNQEKQTI